MKVYELGAETHEITPEDAAHALAYGMMAVQPGLDMLAVTAGDDAAALTAALQDGAEPFAALAACGTLPIAAACGAIIAARLAHVPVVTDGAGATAAVALLRAINPSAADHCRDAYDILAKKARLTTGVAGALSVPFVKSLLKV